MRTHLRLDRIIITARRCAERGICYANSVCPSVTRVLCIKAAERIIEILSRSDRLIILVLSFQLGTVTLAGWLVGGKSCLSRVCPRCK